MKANKLVLATLIAIIVSVLSQVVYIKNSSNDCSEFLCGSWGYRDGFRGVPVPWQVVIDDNSQGEKSYEVIETNPVLLAANILVITGLIYIVLKKFEK